MCGKEGHATGECVGRIKGGEPRDGIQTAKSPEGGEENPATLRAEILKDFEEGYSPSGEATAAAKKYSLDFKTPDCQ